MYKYFLFLVAILLFLVVDRFRNLLFLKSPCSILSGSKLKSNKFNVFLSKRLGGTPRTFYPLEQHVCLKIEAHTRVKVDFSVNSSNDSLNYWVLMHQY